MLRLDAKHTSNRSASIRSRSNSTSRQSRHSNPRSRSRSSLRDGPARSNSCELDPRSQPQRDSLRSKFERLLNLMENCHQRQTEQERRFNRMEVTMNKTLIMVGDLINSKNSHVQHDDSNNRPMNTESEGDDFDEFDVPKFPILNLQNDLKNRRYKRFLVSNI